jgi:hypothetical protein
VFPFPALSGRFGFILRESTGLKGRRARQAVPFLSMSAICAGFRLQVFIFSGFRLDASDHFSYH